MQTHKPTNPTSAELIQAATYQMGRTLSPCSVMTNVVHPENRDATLGGMEGSV